MLGPFTSVKNVATKLNACRMAPDSGAESWNRVGTLLYLPDLRIPSLLGGSCESISSTPLPSPSGVVTLGYASSEFTTLGISLGVILGVPTGSPSEVPTELWVAFLDSIGVYIQFLASFSTSP